MPAPKYDLVPIPKAGWGNMTTEERLAWMCGYTEATRQHEKMFEGLLKRTEFIQEEFVQLRREADGLLGLCPACGQKECAHVRRA
jgi:hypothetical protein